MTAPGAEHPGAAAAATAPVMVVIQSRLSSSRLPGKGLLPVAGMPMAVLAARRAATTGRDVVVATSTAPEDDMLARALEAASVRCVRGPLHDTLGRFARTLEGVADETVVVRLTADNVVPDGELVDLLAAELVRRGAGYVRIGGPDSPLPYGVAGEATTAGLLREAALHAVDPAHREHVMPWIRERHGDVEVGLDVPAAWAGLRCTVDTFADYVVADRLFVDVADPVGTPWRDLCTRLAATTVPVGGPDRDRARGRLVLGTVQLGVAYGATHAGGVLDGDAADAILDACLETGVRALDTARAYGIAEQRIGVWRSRRDRGDLRVTTKVRPLDDVPVDGDLAHGRAAVRESVLESLTALRASSVDTVLLHRAADWWRAGGGVRSALADLVEGGTTRSVGASLSTPDELLRLLGDPLCSAVQLPFNLLDERWSAPVVQAALEARPDVHVVCRSVYLQGLLLSPDPSHWPVGLREHAAPVHAALDALVADLGRSSTADLCCAYVLGHPWVDAITLGAHTPDHVRAAADAVGRPPLTAEESAEVRRRVPTVPERLLDPSRWATA